MTTEDRDVESANPSKNLEVDFDQRSGFFTPVWESKRRVRSEAAEGDAAPAVIAATDSPAAPESEASTAAAAAPAAAFDATPSRSASEATPSKAPASPRTQGGKNGGKGRGASAKAGKPGRSRSTRAAPGGAPELAAENAKGSNPSSEAASDLAAAASSATPPADGAAPPGSTANAEPQASPTLAESPVADGPEARPSPIAMALQHAGPNPPAKDYVDSEPEFREPAVPRGMPARAERPAANHRSHLASAAATAVHERLKAKLTEEALPPESKHSVDSYSEELRSRASGEPANAPYPPHVLRRLRRTLRLSTPLPEPVRAKLAKYARN